MRTLLIRINNLFIIPGRGLIAGYTGNAGNMHEYDDMITYKNVALQAHKYVSQGYGDTNSSFVRLRCDMRT